MSDTAIWSPGNAGQTAPALSIVAPCYNEEATLPTFMARMVAAAEAAVGSDYEIILVNDGSRDGTWSVIVSMTKEYARVLGVDLSRNYGHQIAATAGLRLSRGRSVLVIDADLQDPPELLPQMIGRMAEGYDVVYGRRRTRASESGFKLITAKMFYRLLGRLAEIDIPFDTGDFRLMSRRITDQLNNMPEQDRFLRGMVAWLGGRQTEIVYDRDARFAGHSGYSLGKMLRLAVSGLVGFSTVPLNIAVVLALLGSAIGLGLVLYVLSSFLAGHVVTGWTSLALLIVFFGVGQLVCLAIIGVYLGRTFMETKRRPLFFISGTVSSAEHDSPPKAAEQSRAPESDSRH